MDDGPVNIRINEFIEPRAPDLSKLATVTFAESWITIRRVPD
jgi:hypothetical protein